MKLKSRHKLLVISLVVLGVQQGYAQNPYQYQMQQQQEQQQPQQNMQQQPQQNMQQQQPQQATPQTVAPTPTQPDMPQIQSGQQPQTQAQTTTANPANPCGDKPTCEMTVNATDFYKYLAVCSKLGGASIKWKMNQYYGMTIRANQQGTCTLDVAIIDKAVNTCTFTDAQIAKMTTPDALAKVKQYDANPDPQLLLVVMKPIFDCVGPMPNLQNLLPNVQNMMQKIVPAAQQIQQPQQQQPAQPAQPVQQPVQQ